MSSKSDKGPNANKSSPTNHSPATAESIGLPPPRAIYIDNSNIECGFSYIGNQKSTEVFQVKEYKVWNHYAEALYDRNLISTSSKEYDHMTYPAGLIHTQKLIYVYLCEHWGFGYSAKSPEKFKIRPLRVDISSASLVRKNKEIRQKLWVDTIKTDIDGSKEVNATSIIQDLITIKFTAKIDFINPV